MVEKDVPVPSVAFLGPRSTYTHQAALEYFDAKKHSFVPQVTIADVFNAVQSRACTYGVVPFENSTNGSVVFTLDLFCDRDNKFPDVHVMGETYVDVHHCLLGHPTTTTTTTDPSSPPNFSHVKKIYSHPQAFGQCERFLTQHLRGVERVDVSSTSKAAELASLEPNTTVAIASRAAAAAHGVAVLAADIEDSHDNTTRFLVISATETSVPSSPPPSPDKTLLTFTIDHKQPGALCDCLKVFKDYALNLTSLASRPSRLIPWNYIFFVEFEGHEEEENVRVALEDMGQYCKSLRILGSYRDRQKKRV
ncbi:Prephenate dehydratase-domain-containing protein [Peziza echinospora]|nr:Prephenate dehydratase-domain-containing protein [Peziza echinospora]